MLTFKNPLFITLFLLSFSALSQDSTHVFSCGFDESKLEPSFLANIDTRSFKESADGFYSARIAIDIDYNTFEHFGFNEELIRFELNKMIQKVSLVYEKEINTKLIVSEVHIWKTENSDPYKDEIDIFNLLSTLRKNAIVNKIFKNEFDFYMYLPIKNFTGAGGVASGGGNVSPWGGFKTMAHELGHNFGSPHTQSCSWKGGPLDFCYPSEGTCYENPLENKEGTIMSYCNITLATFHPQVRNLMQKYAGQYLKFNNSIPSSPVLDSIINNNLNLPFISFKPVLQSEKYYYEISSNASFENIVFSDTISIPSLYFNEYANFIQYYLRVKAINQFGASKWSNTATITNDKTVLSTPIPDSTYNKKYLNLSSLNNERLNFTSVKNSEGYEIEVFPYYKGSIPVGDNFNYKYTSNINSFSIQEITKSLKSDLMWRVRAYNENNKGNWSEFQYIFSIQEYFYSDFDLNRPLTTSFSITRNENNGTITNFKLLKISNNEAVELPESKIQKEKYRYLFLNVDANSIYKVICNVLNKNHEIWEEKSPGLLYSYEKTLTTGSETLPQNWQLFSTNDSTINMDIYSGQFTPNSMFLVTNNGLLKYNLTENISQIYNLDNTNGHIGNKIQLLKIDNENNLWLVQKISKRINYDGAFPNPVYSAMKFNSSTMELMERIDFEYTELASFISFDPNQLVFSTGSKLLKLDNEKLVDLVDLLELNKSSNRYNHIGFVQKKYWMRRTQNNAFLTELVAINPLDGSIEVFNSQNYNNLPFTFSDVFFDKLGNPLILNPNDFKVYRFQGNQFVLDADLTFPTGTILRPTYDKGIYTARIYANNETGMYKFYNSQWNKVSDFPLSLYNFYENITDQKGNIWLRNYNALIKVDVCSEIPLPTVLAETQIDFGNSTTVEVSGCSDVNWSFSNLTGDISDNGFSSKTFKPNRSFTYQVSCNDKGCTSNSIENQLVVVPKLAINTAKSNTICTNGEVQYSPSILGEYPKENEFKLVLSNKDQLFEISSKKAEGPYSLNSRIPAGTYWSKLMATNPASISSDSVLISVVEPGKLEILGTPDLCNGSLGRLTANVAGNEPFKYFWSDLGTKIYSSEKSFKIDNPGLYLLTIIDGNGCKTFSETIESNRIDLSNEKIISNGHFNYYQIRLLN
jgi:hypothetical protein